MIGVWLTQGRLEDYRSEFVYGVHESIVHCKLSQEPTEIEGSVRPKPGFGIRNLKSRSNFGIWNLKAGPI